MPASICSSVKDCRAGFLGRPANSPAWNCANPEGASTCPCASMIIEVSPWMFCLRPAVRRRASPNDVRSACCAQAAAHQRWCKVVANCDRRCLMAAIVRLSHIGFNIPRQIFDSECEFWEQVMGLERVHGQDGRNAFFTADRLRDHEFILFAVDEPVASAGQSGCFVNHVGFDVPTAMEVAEFA